jgi:stage II sporulation protein D
MQDPALQGVVCGEQEKSQLVGAPRPRHEHPLALTSLEWKGELLSRTAGSKRRPASRRDVWNTALSLAGLPPSGSPPSELSAGPALAAIVGAFHLDSAGKVHVGELDRSYDSGPPDPAASFAPASRAAYEEFLRLKLAGDAVLPAPGVRMSELEFAGLLLSVAVRMGGVHEIAGRFARRDGGHLVMKTSAGPVTVDADPSLWIARKAGGRYFPAPEITLRSGDPVVFWRRGGRTLGVVVEYAPAGATFEKESGWTEWVRRVSARELALRLAARTPGTEVRDVVVKRRGASGRVLEAVVVTDRSQITLSGFDLRQALELPELIFTVTKTVAPDGSPELLFFGRGWGHGVGLCQNGAYGMALSGSKSEQILRHYYTGIDITPYAPGM